MQLIRSVVKVPHEVYSDSGRGILIAIATGEKQLHACCPCRMKQPREEVRPCHDVMRVLQVNVLKSR